MVIPDLKVDMIRFPPNTLAYIEFMTRFSGWVKNIGGEIYQMVFQAVKKKVVNLFKDLLICQNFPMIFRIH